MVSKITLLSLLLLASCQSASFCSVADALGGPHRHRHVVIMMMDDQEVKQELKYNKTGAELCGWKP